MLKNLLRVLLLGKWNSIDILPSKKTTKAA
jgi:hypothetical protein